MVNSALLGWGEFANAVNELAPLVRPAMCAGLYGVPRGGLPLAVTLSHRVGLPLLNAPRDGMIVVDDIADSGSTIMDLQRQHHVLQVVTWFRRSTCPVAVTFAREAPPGVWVVFPWERLDQALAEMEAYRASR